MFRITGLVLAVVLASASAAYAQPRTTATQFDTGLQSYTVKLSSYLDLQSEISALFDILGSRITEAAALAERKATPDEAQRWVGSWRGPLAAEVASLDARARALEPLAPEEINAVFEGQEARAQLLAADERRQMPARLLGALKPLVTKIEMLAPLAAAGDQSALESLRRAGMEITISAIQAETAGLHVERRLAASEHPQLAVVEASIAVNDGLIAILQAVQSATENPDADLKAYARRIKVAAQQTRVAAERMPRFADIMLGSVQARKTQADVALMPKIEIMFATYRSSAEVELKFAALLNKVAENIERDGVNEGFDAPLADMADLFDERSELQRQRNTALSS